MTPKSSPIIAIDDKILRRFLKLAGDRLSGNWVILGGSVLTLLGTRGHVTSDIDLAGPQTATQKDTLILMDIAQQVGLCVEAINQAGAFFLFKIKDWKTHLVEVYRAKHAVFFRPDCTLFLLLKIPRLSETDLLDCLQMLKLEKESADVVRIQKQITTALRARPHEERRRRLIELERAVGTAN